MTTIRVGICVLVAFAVLAHGAVEPWSEALLEVGAAALFALWGILALRQRQVEIRWTWLYLPLLGLGAFALLQQVSGLSAYPSRPRLSYSSGELICCSSSLRSSRFALRKS